MSLTHACSNETHRAASEGCVLRYYSSTLTVGLHTSAELHSLHAVTHQTWRLPWLQLIHLLPPQAVLAGALERSRCRNIPVAAVYRHAAFGLIGLLSYSWYHAVDLDALVCGHHHTRHAAHNHKTHLPVLQRAVALHLWRKPAADLRACTHLSTAR
jgi:hypothetical protein